MTIKRNIFSDKFIFGTATSAYQIEGHNFGGAGETIWDVFANKPGKVHAKQNGSVACDHYHRFKDDLDLLKNAGFDAYRFSFSWARLFPDGRKINPAGEAFYDRLIDAMLERGLKPFATAYHWEMPQALDDKPNSGWLSRDTAIRFGDYVGFLARRYGSRLETLATINEPWCASWLSYMEGHHAPGLNDISAAAKSMHYIMLAHGEGVKAARKETDIPVGIVMNFTPGYSYSDSSKDKAALERHEAFTNEWFIASAMRGEYPKVAIDAFIDYLPDDWQNDLKIISTPIDFLGINYYSSLLIKDGGDKFPFVTVIDRKLPKTDMGWEIDPMGFNKTIEFVASYTGDLPIYITENGMASKNRIDDEDRIDYLTKHLEIAANASKNLPLKGYFVWSLLDNFEWAFGYEKRFGIVNVDYETMQRTPKKSYYWLKSWLKS